MKHIYNPTKAAYTQRPSAKATGTAAASKILSLLLLSFFLLVSGESVGQGTPPYANDFNSKTKQDEVDTRLVTKGTVSFVNGEMTITTGTGQNNGFEGWIRIMTGYQVKAGYKYNVSFQSKVSGNGSNKEAVFSVKFGNPNTSFANSGAQVLPPVKLTDANTIYQNFTSTSLAYNAAETLVIGIQISGAKNNAILNFDNLIVTESCAAEAPQVTSANTCAASASLKLGASSTSTGGTYKWYTVPVGGTASISQTGSEFITPTLTQTTTYYVAYLNSAGCESVRVPVTAYINQLPKPIVTSDSECRNGDKVVVFSAEGAGNNENYRWYNSSGGIVATGPSITRTLTESNETGVHYVVKFSTTTAGCESEPEYLFVPNKSLDVAKPADLNLAACIGSSRLLDPAIELGMTYRWYSASNQLLAEARTYTIDNVLAGTTTYYYEKFNPATGCVSPRATIRITADQAALVPGRIEGLAAVCQGPRTVTYNVLSVSGASYTWSITPNTGSSGATFTGQGTNAIVISYPNSAFVGKVSVTVRNNCSEYTESLEVQATNSNTATGEIIQPPILALNQPAEFKFETNVHPNEIERVQWFIRRVGSTNWEAGANTRDWVIQSMDGNVDGVRVAVRVKEPNSCFGSLGALSVGMTGFEANSFLIDNLPITPLPVELMFFKAQAQTKGVNLTWATASELENKGFEVQVSTNARDFKAIGFVESKVGTTMHTQHYGFLDTKAVSGTRYYRLKQIDFDGTTSYSPIRAVALNSENVTVTAYPNPFDDAVVVTLNGTEARNVQVVLMDAMGKVLQQRTEETSGNSITVDMRNITTKGMYVLHVLDNDTKHTFKLMKR